MKHPVISIATNEWRHILRDKYTVLLAVICPVFYILIFGLTTTIDINYLKVAAVVPHPTPETAQFIEPLLHNPFFRYVGTLRDVEEGKELMRRDKLNAIVVLHPDFGKLSETYRRGDSDKASVQIITDAANPFIGSSAYAYIAQALPESVSDGLGGGVSVNMRHNPKLLSVYYFGPGFMGYAIIFFCIMLVAASFAKERESGSIFSIIASPTKTWELIAGKMLPYLAVGIVVYANCMLINNLALGVPVRGSVAGITILAALYIITSLLLGIVIALFATTQASAIVLASSIVTLPVSYFCGIYSPVENMPQWAQEISKLFYVSWFMDALRKMMIEGQNFAAVLKDVAVMSLSTLLFFFICIFRTKGDRWLS